jgi:hypothetical protein
MAVTVLVLWLMAEFPGQPLGFGDVKLGGLIAFTWGGTALHLAIAGVAIGVYFWRGVGGGTWLMGKLSWRDEVAFGPVADRGLVFWPGPRVRVQSGVSFI